MKTKNIRLVVVAVIFLVLSAGLIGYVGLGTLSGFGWQQIAALCPLGAFTTMIATKTFIPRAVVSIVIMGILVFLVGRAFCAWICPVPLLQKVKEFFSSAKSRKTKAKKKSDEALEIASFELGCKGGCENCASKCATSRAKFDSRHYVLGGALLSTAIFGFPVFCLICPVGLTFATIIGLWNLVQFNEPSWALIIFPIILVAEVTVLRKWCSKICPISALVSLLSNLNVTLRPRVKADVCLRSRGVDCHSCVDACPEQLDPHSGRIPECSKCGKCVEACPAKAISVKLLK